MTRWSSQVDPNHPLPEYPRPQFVRERWLNLNGIWEFQPGQEGDAPAFGKSLSRKICVPFGVESALSGVMEHHDRIWYRKLVRMPEEWADRDVLLHFGAVDWESEVYVNGKSIGIHRGGYDPHSYNIKPYLSRGDNEIIVRVFDPTEFGGQPRGKQTTKPGGIMYTPTTGIWQTVWLEPVPASYIDDVLFHPDIDAARLKVMVSAVNASPESTVTITVKDGSRVIATAHKRRVRPGSLRYRLRSSGHRIIRFCTT